MIGSALKRRGCSLRFGIAVKSLLSVGLIALAVLLPQLVCGAQVAAGPLGVLIQATVALFAGMGCGKLLSEKKND